MNFSVSSESYSPCYFLCLKLCLFPLFAKQWHCSPASVCTLFSTSILCYVFFFFFCDPINGIWFTQSHLYQCLCKVGQLVINLKFILDGKGILNLLFFFFFFNGWKSPGCLQKIFLLVFTSPQVRLPGKITPILGEPFLTPQECESWPGWSWNSDLKYVWPLGSEKVAAVLCKGPLGHNSIRIPREMRFGRQNSDFPAFSRGPRRDIL